MGAVGGGAGREAGVSCWDDWLQLVVGETEGMSIHVTKGLVVLVILRLDLPPAGLLRAPQEFIVGFSEQVRLRRWKASDRLRVEKQIVRPADMVLPLLLGCGGEVVDRYMAPLALPFGVEDAPLAPA